MPLYINRKGKWVSPLDLFVEANAGAWNRILNMYVKQDDTWVPLYTYVPYHHTSVSASVSSTSVVAPTPITVTGTVLNSDTNAPVPSGMTVELWNGDPSTGTLLLSTTTDANGAYSFSYTPTVPANMSLVVNFPTSGYFVSSSASAGTVAVSVTTSMSVQIPNMQIGSANTVSGKVAASAGTVPGGTVNLIIGGATRASTSVGSDGSFSLSFTPLSSDRGTRASQLQYTGTGNYNGCYTATKGVTYYQPTPSAPSQTVQSISNTGVTLKFSDQANVDHFVSKCTETGAIITVSSTGKAGATLNAVWNTLTPDRSYHFTITAYSDNPTNGSASGNTVSAVMGHPAVTDSGTATFTFSPLSTGSWRSADAWKNRGSLMTQGYYTTGNGSYYGVALFDTAAMQQAVNSWGTDTASRHTHVSCTDLQVYAARETGGNGDAAVPLHVYLGTGNVPGSTGQPTLSAGPQNTAGPTAGNSQWCDLPNAANNWGVSLLSGNYSSLVIYVNNSTDYAIYDGDQFQVKMTLTWNWTPTAYKAPTWSA